MASGENLENLSAVKRALYEIRTLKARVAELERAQQEPIAIVGLGLRFPGGARDAATFWDVLSRGVDAVSEIPPSRWPIDRFYDRNADVPGKMYARHGAFLEDVASFDADFFGISPREANSLDPQHRLALEVAWEALENAGCSPAGLDGTASGVFLAMSNSDYGRMVFGRPAEIDAYSSTGTIFSAMAGRISYLLGLQGPSMVVDTACSGSLVALHLACQSLRSRECSMALAGGVNLILSPEVHINFSKSRMMSPDGHCKSFDASADGYVRGEGCGIVVLKRLADALTAGDEVLAIVRSSAVNQDGRSSGITAPNGPAQEALIRRAIHLAGVQPNQIDYVEAHGTGTSLGDPIEARALAAVLANGRPAEEPLLVGSVKSNISHLEAAAGVAGLIKVVLALHNERIPANLHFRKLNPHIDWNDLPVRIPIEAQPWKRGARRRLAGVSSFGFSGTNAHVILEEAPLREPVSRECERPLHIIAISARSGSALARLEKDYANHLKGSGDNLGDICFTANTGRAPFAHRAAYVGDSRERIIDSAASRGIKEETPEIVFLFPGQGAQYAGMGQELYQTHPVFHGAIDQCAELLKGELEEPLPEVLWGRSTDLLHRTAYTQPALFAVEYALSRLWRSWGIEPAAVLGHSVGEYAAACVAGVYGLEEGLAFIAARARLMQQAGGQGAMSAVSASEERIREALNGIESRVSIAAVNAPESIVISGYEEELKIAEERLRRQGARIQRLAVSHAFHSPQMSGIESAFAAKAGELNWRAPQMELISSVTGGPVGPTEMADPEYWRRQVRQPVLFRKAIEALRGRRVFLEVGPGTTLSGVGRQCVDDAKNLWTPSLRKGRGEWEQLLASLGGLFVRGAEVNWEAFDEPYRRRRVALPTYPFERQRYWIESPALISGAEADPQTRWDWILESAGQQASQGRLDLNVSSYAGKWTALDALATAYIITALRQMGLFLRAGERHTVRSLIDQFGIREAYQKLLRRWLNRLAEEKLLDCDGASYTSARPLDAAPLPMLIDQAARVFQGDRTLFDYARSCGESLAEVLTGKTSPLDTLFPGGSFEVAEGIYEREPIAAYINSLARAALQGYLKGTAGNVAVLEVGGGTGATAASMVAALPPHRSTYHFTDVSDIFTNHAERKFANYPFIHYGRLDLEHPPESQGYAPGSIDVVVANNVLHATRDLRATAAHVRSLLAPGGILILCESTDYLWWYDTTVALVEGWQRFDDGLRSEVPLIPPFQWKEVLQEAGFERVASLPGDDSPAAVLGRHVILAQAPGVAGQGRVKSQSGVAAKSKPVAAAPTNESRKLAEILEAPPAQRHEIVVALVREHIAEMLRFDSVERVERRRRLVEMGLDSLMAVELRNRLGTALELDRPLTATLIFDYPTLDDLATHLERDVLSLDQSPEEQPADALGERAQELEGLDDVEVEALLLKKLQSL